MSYKTTKEPKITNQSKTTYEPKTTNEHSSRAGIPDHVVGMAQHQHVQIVLNN